MTEKKKHHYVPQFYLRNFSSDSSRKTINILNIAQEKTIIKGKLRTQCYKDYFYGKRQNIEDALGALEGETSSVFRKIMNENKISGDPPEIILLCLYLVLQHRRTVSAEKISNEMLDGLMKIVFQRQFSKEDLDKVKISFTYAAILNTSAAIHLSPILYDLKPTLILNKTSNEFITSDNPTVLINKFYEGRFHGAGIGLACAGLLIFLPLSHRHTILLYDQGVYTVPKDKNNTVTINKTSDVSKLNELQILNALENLYFAGSDQADIVYSAFHKVKRRRQSSGVEVAEFVESDTPGKFVRPNSDEAASQQTGSFVTGTSLGLNTKLQLSFLRLRSKRRFFYDGSAAGAQRDPAWCEIITDFSKTIKKGTRGFDQLGTFAASHPLWQQVGTWKNDFFVG